MFYLVGVAHRAQIAKPECDLTNDQQTLAACLTRLVGEIRPSLIAEEQSIESLGKDISIPKQEAEKAGIEPRFCDPDSKQRLRMKYWDRQSISQRIFMSDEGNGMEMLEIDARAGAIEIAQYFPLRERFWLEQLADRKDCEDIVFVCGDAHIESFGSLLESKGISFRVVERAIGVNEEDRESHGRAVRYLEQHPELKRWGEWH